MADLGYIVDPIEADADRLQQEAYDYIQTRWPDWAPNESNLETWLIAACARMVAEAATVASDVPPAIFRYMGKSVLGFPSADPTPATVDSTWILSSNPAGRTIESGTLVGIEDADSNIMMFEVVNAAVLAALDLETDVGQVTLRARDDGVGGNSLGGAGIEAINVESLSWVDTILLAGPTAGGSDGETDEAYLDRLSAYLTLLTPRPVLPDDFALIAKNTAASQGLTVRVIALDGYDPIGATFDNEKTISLAVIDDVTGADVSGAVEAVILETLEGLREINFLIYVIPATRTTVDVTSVIVKKRGWDAASVQSDVESAINSFLSSANWGDDIDTNTREWDRVDTVYWQDVSAVINNVRGVERHSLLTIGIDGGAQSEDDMPIAGAAPLATPGIVDITVT